MIPDTRLLSESDCLDVIRRIERLTRGGGETSVTILSWWNGELSWARNRVALASDRRDIQVRITRSVNQGYGEKRTNQIDDVSLESVVRAAEWDALRGPNPIPGDLASEPSVFPYPDPVIWSDQTVEVTAATRANVAQQLANRADAQDLLSAGYLEMHGCAMAEAGVDFDMQREGMTRARREGHTGLAATFRYVTLTQAQCSMTVRHPKGIGSGWAGSSSYDWKTIDPGALVTRALDACVASVNPVRIEPGRYTVILAPQAVADLVDLLLPFYRTKAFDRGTAEHGQGPFTLGPEAALDVYRTKLGLKVMDERITIDHDPMDPVLGVLPRLDLQSVTWIERGVLKSLVYDRAYAVPNLNEHHGAPYRPSYRMSGGPTSIDEMIASTSRGIFISRFSNLRVLDASSFLATGVTRDGLWLIEQGVMTKAIKNMRITESPLFAFNQVEQLGPPTPVFRPMPYAFVPMLTPAVVPPLKVNDFSFTSTTDAI